MTPADKRYTILARRPAPDPPEPDEMITLRRCALAAVGIASGLILAWNWWSA